MLALETHCASLTERNAKLFAKVNNLVSYISYNNIRIIGLLELIARPHPSVSSCNPFEVLWEDTSSLTETDQVASMTSLTKYSPIYIFFFKMAHNIYLLIDWSIDQIWIRKIKLRLRAITNFIITNTIQYIVLVWKMLTLQTGIHFLWIIWTNQLWLCHL